MKTLFLLAHNDDEFFFVPFLEEALHRGELIEICFTTYGSAYGIEGAVRADESERVLDALGIQRKAVVHLGREEGVFDGFACEQVVSLWKRLMQRYSGVDFAKIYAPAWEGGHPDHDITNMLALRLAEIQPEQVPLLEVPLYNGFRVPPGLFRVMSLIPEVQGRKVELRFPLWDALRYVRLMLFYRSQWRSFLGLGPGILYQFLWRRRVLARQVERRSYYEPPHPGRLFYEHRFNMPFSTVAASISSLKAY